MVGELQMRRDKGIIDIITPVAQKKEKELAEKIKLAAENNKS